MELFALPCTTCHTRLKVRDESAIGKILACPKCGGMVLIKPPADWKAGSSSPSQTASTMTATVHPSYSGSSGDLSPRNPGEANFDDVDQLLASPKVDSKTVIKPAVAPTVPRPQGAAAAAAEIAANPAVTTAPVPSAQATAAPVQPLSPQWGLERPWRYWLVLSGALLVGTLLAIAVVVVAVRWVGPSTTTVGEQLAPPVEKPTDIEKEPSEKLPPTEVTTNEPAPTEPNTPSPSPTPETQVAVNEPRPELPAVPAEPQPKPADPLGIAAVPGENPPQPAPPSKLFGDLDKFGDLLNNTSPDAKKPMAEEPAPVLPIDTNPGKPQSAVNRPAPRKIAAAIRMADKLSGIEAEDVPLLDFLQLISDLSTVPITLETRGLPLFQVTPNSPVKLRASNTTVGQALTDALKSISPGLTYTVLDQQVVVSIRNDMRTISPIIDDLAAGEPAGANTLVQHLTELFVPADWQEGDEGPFVRYKDSVLSVQHQSVVLWEQIELLEKLRNFRKMPLKTKFDPKQFATSTRTDRAAAKLSKAIKLNFNQATNINKITQSLGKSAGVRILIDWRSLLADGWTPDTETNLVVDGKPLAAALDELVEPLEWVWRVVDEETIELTSREGALARLELELYPLPPMTTADDAAAIITRLEQELGIAAGGIRFDPAAGCLVVRLPQQQHRRVAAFLREEKAGS